MHMARGGNRITAAIVVLGACTACMSHPVAAPGGLDPSSAPASSTSAASLSTTSASSIATPAPSAAAASMTPTHADAAGFVDSPTVPCPATSTCMWPTQDVPNALVLYSAATGDVVRPVASTSGADVELNPIGSNYDPQWRYFVQQSGQAGAAPPTVNALMRVPAAGGEPQVVVPNLVQPSPYQAADDYVVSTDGSRVAYLISDEADSIMVATIGTHPTYTTIAAPAGDWMLHLVGWLPDDRTVLAVLPNDDATAGRLVEFDTTAPFALKTIFAPPWPVAYSHDACPDEELAAAIDGDTIALAVGACSAEPTLEPTPQLYFVDAAGKHGPPIAVAVHTPYDGGFSVFDVEFVSDDEVVVLLAHQDCYGPGVWAAVTKSGASHYVPVHGDGCGG
jgi:hypothetical protein